MKLTKHEWSAFWKALNDEWCLDDSDFPDLDEKDMPEIIIGDGILCFQGNGVGIGDASKFFSQSEMGEQSAKFSTVFRRWKKAESVEVISVEIPKEDVKRFRSLCAGHKWKIV